MNMVPKNWSDISTESISEEAIRALHSPQEKFKIYANTYEAGKSFSTKAGHAFVLYVLAGRCKTALDGSEVTLSAGEFIALEKGSYAFDVMGDEEVKLVKVFSLS
jgi:quercetin dioxygenase-like cupin family protein